jgi:hypothetical protein
MSRVSNMKVVSEENVIMLIEKYMEAIGEEDFFSTEEIRKFVDISLKRNLSRKEIVDALDFYSKDYGEFA